MQSIFTTVGFQGMGEMYASDAAGGCIWRIDAELTSSEVVGVPGKAIALSWPAEIGFSPEGHLYVAEASAHQVTAISRDGRVLRRWGTEGHRLGEFSTPEGLCVSTDGMVYVADRDNHRIQIFTLEGVALDSWGKRGEDSGEFQFPSSLALDSRGYLYVADMMNHRIQKMSPSGDVVATWPGIGGKELGMPISVSVDAEDSVYVLDWQVMSVRKLNGYGDVLREINLQGLAIDPGGVAVDDRGLLYVADGEHGIRKVTQSGDLVRTFT